jgi:hypothetical protein
MRLEGVIHCEGPDCNAHERVGVDSMANERLPKGWITVVEHGDFTDSRTAYCGWECLLKAASRVDPPVEIHWRQALGDDA